MIKKIVKRLYQYFRGIYYKFFKHPGDWVKTIAIVKRTILFFDRTKLILGIIDFNKQSQALGDTITFHQNLLVLKQQHYADAIDICLVEDLNMKERPDPKRDLVMQTFPLNPNIEKVYEFDNRSDYNNFKRKNLHRYFFFPNKKHQFTCDHRPLIKYYEKTGSLPRMSVDNPSLDWAKRIISNHISPVKLIVVHIRNSLSIKNPEEFSAAIEGKTGAALRNSNLPEWEKFLENLNRNEYQVICVCAEEEIIPVWREKDLVLFSKDLGADVIKDFALIQCSYLSLFPPSGMFDYALFAGIPCCVFNYPLGYWKRKKDDIYHLNHGLEDYEQYSYQSPYQRLIWGEKDTFDTINYHFNELVEKLKNQGYDEEYQERIGRLKKVKQ